MNVRDAALNLSASLNDFLRATDATQLTHKPERVREFVNSQLHYVPGRSLTFREVYLSFLAWLPESERLGWNRKRFAQSLPVYTPSGPHSANITLVANVAAHPADSDGSIFVKTAGRLKRVSRP